AFACAGERPGLGGRCPTRSSPRRQKTPKLRASSVKTPVSLGVAPTHPSIARSGSPPARRIDRSGAVSTSFTESSGSCRGRLLYRSGQMPYPVARRSPANIEENRMATNRVYRVAVIPGDGIGKEVMPEGVRVLEAAAKRYGFELRQDWFDFASWDYYEKHQRMMPEDWKDKVGQHDAIFFGAVGWPQKIP